MGGSRSSGQSSSGSSGWGFDESFARSLGQSFGNSFQRSNDSSFNNSNSNSVNRTNSSQQSFVDRGQQPFLQDLYRQGQRATNPQAAQRTATALNSQIMPGLTQDFNRLGALANPAGQIKAQTASLQSGLGAMFRNEINPAISSQAIAAGGFGGGRQGVAQGVAAGQLADTFAQQRGQIVQDANATALAAMAGRSDLAAQRFELGMAPTMAAFGPLAAYANLLGGPTVLSNAVSSGLGTSTAVGRAGSSGSSFGRSINGSRNSSVAGSRGYNQSGSWSNSEQDSWGFNFG